jgi:putative ABC transport system permease protein
VANLVLGRAFERRVEFSLRSALGAGTTRLVRQVTVETLILAVAGSILGLGVAVIVMRLLPSDFAATLPRTAVGQLNGTVLAFAVLAALSSTVLAGLVPAIVALRGNVATSLRDGGRAGDGRTRHRTRAALVVAEVSLAIVLLMGSGLLIRTMDALLQVRTGYSPEGVVTMTLSVSGARYDESAAIWAYQRQVLDAARAVPGVTGAAITSQLPLGGNFDGWGIHRPDKPSANPEDDPSAQRFSVSPGYLETMQIAVLEGRGFTEADRAGAAPVALINKTLAGIAFGGEEPIGKAIRVGGADDPAFTIVGIVDDVRHLSLDGEQEAQMYLPFDQRGADGGVSLVVRGTGDAGTLLRRVETAVRAVDPTVALSSQATMMDVVRASTASRQLALVVLSAFAAIALLLSAAGIYGVIAASVAERTREIGVRAALGASRGRIVGQVVGQGALVSAVGLVLGGAAAVATGRMLRSMLYGVAPWDVPTLLGVSALLAVVVLAACALPAWRAARVDPVTALRGG